MRRRDFLGGLAATVGAGSLRLRWPRTGPVLAERWSWAMGQPVHVQLFAGSEGEGMDACAAALAELRRVEAHLSLFDDASDLCELNRHAGRGPMRVSADLRAVLEHSEMLRRRTNGAFNAAVEPLMRAWGFHRRRHTAPTAAEIEEAREATVTAIVDLDGARAHLPNGHTQLDFGSIGVGYGIDRALGVVRSRSIWRAFIDVSGDIAATGAPPGESGWVVGVADPARPTVGATIATIRLRDAALSTAANTESVRRYASLVVGHVMDPATGWPANQLRQASVIARTATESDALSTAMLVSGHPAPGVMKSYEVPAA